MMENTESSGGTRFSEGKPGMWWAIPLYGLRLIAVVTKKGSEKYAPRDWAEGQSFSTLIDCAMRHMIEVCHRGPWAVDEDTGAYHLANAGWNILCLLSFMALERHDLDDVTKWHGVTTAMKNEMEAKSDDPREPTPEKMLYVDEHGTVKAACAGLSCECMDGLMVDPVAEYEEQKAVPLTEEELQRLPLPDPRVPRTGMEWELDPKDGLRQEHEAQVERACRVDTMTKPANPATVRGTGTGSGTYRRGAGYGNSPGAQRAQSLRDRIRE